MPTSGFARAAHVGKRRTSGRTSAPFGFCGTRRALIYASPGDIHFALDATCRFSLVQREALALEARMKSAWASIEADLVLTHSVTRRQQRRQRHVNELTETVTRMKVDWLRITNCLEQLDPKLPEASKRLFAELVSGAALYDRRLRFAVERLLRGCPNDRRANPPGDRWKHCFWN